MTLTRALCCNRPCPPAAAIVDEIWFSRFYPGESLTKGV